MAINITLGVRRDVDPQVQPIPRKFVGFDPSEPDEQLWNANRGAWELPDGAALEQFATFSHDGTVRLVAELEGIESVVEDGRVVQALMGRILHRGDPVRDALVGASVEEDESGFTFFDTTVQDAMLPAERYAPTERSRRTFLLTHDPDQWFWGPEDEARLIERTAAGATVREVRSAGGRKQGLEPGDQVFLLQVGSGDRGIRGRGVVSSRVYPGEHWDDPNRTANYVDIDWHLVLPVEQLIPVDVLLGEVPGYGWNPQKSGVELHEPMAAQAHELWERTVGAPAQRTVEQQPGWAVDDARRRAMNQEARRRTAEHFAAEGWEVSEATDDRPYCQVAYRGEEQRYLFAKGTETMGRPVLLDADEVAHILAHPGECLLGQLSDAAFLGGSLVPGSGVLTVVELGSDAEAFSPVLYRHHATTA